MVMSEKRFYLPIQNEDAFDRCHLLHNPGCNSNIVEKAKTHWAIWFCVMTWRANDRKRFLQIPTSHGKCSLDNPSTA
jgi:hypothetical protein